MELELRKCNLQVADSVGEGRGLVAPRSFASGVAVLEEQPLACVADAGVRCDHCLSPITAAPLRCSRCKLVRYCNVTCQRSAWRDLHKQECPILSAYTYKATHNPSPSLPAVLPSTLWLVLRLLLRRANHTSESEWRWRAFDDMCAHMDEHSTERVNEYSQMCMLLLSLVGGVRDGHAVDEHVLGVSLPELQHWLARLSCNMVTVSDDEFRAVGKGVYPCASLINHSCDPNSVLLFRNNALCLKTLRPVAEGEQLTVAYVDVGRARKERREHLKKEYFFDCACARCEREQEDEQLEWKLRGLRCVGGAPALDTQSQVHCTECNATHEVDELVASRDQARELYSTATRHRERGDTEGAKRTLLRALDIQEKVLSVWHCDLKDTLNSLSMCCVDLGQFGEALVYLSRALALYVVAHPAGDPHLALTRYVCGKLAWHQGKATLAVECCDLALPVLRCSHGGGHPLVEELHRLRVEAAMEANLTETHSLQPVRGAPALPW